MAPGTHGLPATTATSELATNSTQLTNRNVGVGDRPVQPTATLGLAPQPKAQPQRWSWRLARSRRGRRDRWPNSPPQCWGPQLAAHPNQTANSNVGVGHRLDSSSQPQRWSWQLARPERPTATLELAGKPQIRVSGARGTSAKRPTEVELVATRPNCQLQRWSWHRPRSRLPTATLELAT